MLDGTKSNVAGARETFSASAKMLLMVDQEVISVNNDKEMNGHTTRAHQSKFYIPKSISIA